MSSSRPLTLEASPGVDLSCLWTAARAGGSPTVLYLHGFGSRQDGEKGEYFRGRAIEGGLGFFSLDFRGHGASGGGMRGLTLSRCLEDVTLGRAFLTRRGAGPVVVMGSSMGGLVGLWHAALEPAGLLAGLYIAPALGLGEDLAVLLGEEGMKRWRETGTMEVTNELGSFEVGWGMASDLGAYPSERLAELHRVPSLLFQGKLDDRVSWRRVAAFADQAAGEVRLELFERGDHRLLDERDEMWRRMLDYLATRSAPVGRRQAPFGATTSRAGS